MDARTIQKCTARRDEGCEENIESQVDEFDFELDDSGEIDAEEVMEFEDF